MSSKRFKVDLSRFLDVEAVDQGYETSSGDDTDNGTPLVDSLLVPRCTLLSDFVKNMEDFEICGPMPLQSHRRDDSLADEADRLAAIAYDTQVRFDTRQLNTFPDPGYPTLTDAPIWRVRVKVTMIVILRQ
jgi:hypothetical protein